MNGRHTIEARLDRSLGNQIKVPRLDQRFDAAVWARITVAEAKATNPVSTQPSRALRVSRWLAITNSIGITVTLGIAAYFALRTFGGIETPMSLGVNVPVSMPVISDAMVTQIMGVLGQVLGFAALALGLSLTPFGRRVRSAFS